MTLRVCVAGATGWAGRAVAEGVLGADDLELRSAVSRSAAGTDLGLAWGGAENGVPVFAAVADALDEVDVFVDYTAHSTVLGHALAAIERGVSVVIGTSGLGADDFDVIAESAERAGVGVVAAGNFSLTAAMMQAAALLVARHLPNREIIDFASAGKKDAPSGTARELAERLGDGERAGAGRSRSPTWPGIRGARRDHRRHPGALAAAAELLGIDRGRVRPARRAADHPARRGLVGHALRRRDVAGHPRRPGRTGLIRGLDTLLSDR